MSTDALLQNLQTQSLVDTYNRAGCNDKLPITPVIINKHTREKVECTTGELEITCETCISIASITRIDGGIIKDGYHIKWYFDNNLIGVGIDSPGLSTEGIMRLEILDDCGMEYICTFNVVDIRPPIDIQWLDVTNVDFSTDTVQFNIDIIDYGCPTFYLNWRLSSADLFNSVNDNVETTGIVDIGRLHLKGMDKCGRIYNEYNPIPNITEWIYNSTTGSFITTIIPTYNVITGLSDITLDGGWGNMDVDYVLKFKYAQEDYDDIPIDYPINNTSAPEVYWQLYSGDIGTLQEFSGTYVPLFTLPYSWGIYREATSNAVIGYSKWDRTTGLPGDEIDIFDTFPYSEWSAGVNGFICKLDDLISFNALDALTLTTIPALEYWFVVKSRNGGPLYGRISHNQSKGYEVGIATSGSIYIRYYTIEPVPVIERVDSVYTITDSTDTVPTTCVITIQAYKVDTTIQWHVYVNGKIREVLVTNLFYDDISVSGNSNTFIGSGYQLDTNDLDDTSRSFKGSILFFGLKAGGTSQQTIWNSCIRKKTAIGNTLVKFVYTGLFSVNDEYIVFGADPNTIAPNIGVYQIIPPPGSMITYAVSNNIDLPNFIGE